MNRFAVISGSHRSDGASHQVAKSLAGLLPAALPGRCADVISIATLPFWDEGLWGAEDLAEKWSEWHEIATRLESSDGLVVVAPEYAGMVPPKLSNFLLLCSAAHIGHKPALAVGVSSTRGGTYPISQLRAYGYKNNRLCWIPDHLILRDVENPASPLADDTNYVYRYAVHCLQLLDQYASALKTVRSSGVVDYERFPYGM